MEANRHSLFSGEPVQMGFDPSLVRVGQVRYVIYRRLMAAYRWLLAVGLVTVTLVLVGYGFGFRVLYQPFEGAPGTHFLTALAASFVLYSQAIWKPYARFRRPERLGYQIAGSIASYAMFCWAYPQSKLNMMVQIDGVIERWLGVPYELQMGWNTSVTILLIVLAQALRRRHRGLALLVSSLSPFLPLSALVGHVLSLDLVHGAMSLPTILIFLPLSLVSFLSFVHVREVRVLISDTALGKLGRIQFLSAAVVPLFLGGVYAFGGSENHMAENTARFVISMIWFVAVIVVFSARAHEFTERKRRENERNLARASTTDVLTGASNRLGASLKIGRGGFGAGSGVILVDFDRFKSINDKFGHSAGDRVLVEATILMRKGLRDNDVLARWGGEEFLIVLPGAGDEITLLVAERMREKIQGVLLPDIPLPLITASFGVSTVAKGDISIEPAVNRADKALYQAKDAGRDRVRSFFPDPNAL